LNKDEEIKWLKQLIETEQHSELVRVEAIRTLVAYGEDLQYLMKYLVSIVDRGRSEDSCIVALRAMKEIREAYETKKIAQKRRQPKRRS